MLQRRKVYAECRSGRIQSPCLAADGFTVPSLENLQCFTRFQQCKSSSPTASPSPGLPGLGSFASLLTAETGIAFEIMGSSALATLIPAQIEKPCVSSRRLRCSYWESVISSNFQVMTDAADGVETISRTSNGASKGVSAGESWYTGTLDVHGDSA